MKKITKRTKTIAIFVIIQCLIIGIFLYLLPASKTVSENELKQTYGKVENTDLLTTNKMDDYFIVTVEDENYWFGNITHENDLTIYELHEEVSIGDEISIFYIERFTVLGKRNMVVKAAEGEKELRTLSGYNSDVMPTVALVVFFLIIEVFLLSVFILYLIACKMKIF